MECPRGVETREEVMQRRRQVEGLNREGAEKTVEEMGMRYPVGRTQDPRKVHGNNGHGGIAPNYGPVYD